MEDEENLINQCALACLFSYKRHCFSSGLLGSQVLSPSGIRWSSGDFSARSCLPISLRVLQPWLLWLQGLDPRTLGGCMDGLRLAESLESRALEVSALNVEEDGERIKLLLKNQQQGQGALLFCASFSNNSHLEDLLFNWSENFVAVGG
jgi:hypothetical protein